jgi:hypothetical protein
MIYGPTHAFRHQQETDACAKQASQSAGQVRVVVTDNDMVQSTPVWLKSSPRIMLLHLEETKRFFLFRRKKVASPSHVHMHTCRDEITKLNLWERSQSRNIRRRRGGR